MIKILFIVLGLNFISVDTDLVALRKQLDVAANDSKAADKLNARLKGLDEQKAAPVMIAFKAISELILAKHAFNPMSKVSHFKKGKRMLEAAVARDPKNPEVIFFRYTTQVNVPAMLNYSSNVKEDRQLLINYLKVDAKAPKDVDLHKRIKKYLLTDKPGTKAETDMLKNL